LTNVAFAAFCSPSGTVTSVTNCIASQPPPAEGPLVAGGVFVTLGVLVAVGVSVGSVVFVGLGVSNALEVSCAFTVSAAAVWTCSAELLPGKLQALNKKRIARTDDTSFIDLICSPATSFADSSRN
jgi:hypothetical protein